MLIIDSMTLNRNFCKYGSSKILALLFKWNSKQFCIPESHFNNCKLAENKKKWLKQEHNSYSEKPLSTVVYMIISGIDANFRK